MCQMSHQLDRPPPFAPEQDPSMDLEICAPDVLADACIEIDLGTRAVGQPALR
jgi:hypothetical protein